jgi:hypothetical protein
MSRKKLKKIKNSYNWSEGKGNFGRWSLVAWDFPA